MGRRNSRLQSPKPRRLGLYGFDCADGTTVVMAADGSVLCRVGRDRIGKPSRVGMSKRVWELAISQMVEKFCRQINGAGHSKLDAWGRKCATWVVTQHDLTRPATGGRYFDSARRNTWEKSIKCMRFQFKNAESKHRRYGRDKWWIWAETVSRNHRRKAAKYDGNPSGTSGDDREAAVQMQWQWCAT